MVSFDPYNFRITSLSARKSEQMKTLSFIYCLNTKIRSTMLCLSGFELYSRLVPLFPTVRMRISFTCIFISGRLHLESYSKCSLELNWYVQLIVL